jgi:hypothetical protein
MKYVIRCGVWWYHVTLGYGTAWATAADPERATRFDTRADAETARRLAGLGSQFTIQEEKMEC